MLLDQEKGIAMEPTDVEPGQTEPDQAFLEAVIHLGTHVVADGTQGPFFRTLAKTVLDQARRRLDPLLAAPTERQEDKTPSPGAPAGGKWEITSLSADAVGQASSFVCDGTEPFAVAYGRVWFKRAAG